MALAGAAAVSALFQVLFEKLISSAMDELGLLLNVHADLETLRNTVLTVRDVLEDAEKRSVTEKVVSNWLSKLKDAAFDADDVLDEFRSVMIHHKATIMQSRHVMGKVRSFFSPSNPFTFHLKMARKIREITERLDLIAAERTKFHLIQGSGSSLETRIRSGGRRTNSYVNESEVYGRNDDKERIIHFLTEMGDERSISMLPIVGMGGLGKTTLAQLAFNDERTKSHLDLQMWICVSEDFNPGKIIKTIMDFCDIQNRCDLSSEPMQQSLVEILSRTLFLLVLDDVWNENEEKWEDLKNLLQVGMKGSKVIVTTRSERVASIMGTVPSCHLKCLSEDHCWKLFKQRAFGLGRAEEAPRLVTIGKEIIKKCGGVPLAAKLLGSMMAFKRGDREWLAVRDSEIWELPEDEIGIIPALRLSYDHLPSRLKPCFAYCALFPRDYRIDKEKLIELWIAEGFILPSNENLHAEDTGDEYFNNLFWRSFFQDVQKNNYTNKITCKMHDLIHDLARHVAGHECWTVEIGMEGSIPRGCRYFSLVCDRTSWKISKPSYEGKKLRSFLLLLQESITHVDWKCAVKEVPLKMFAILSCLRALDLSKSSIKQLPETIGMLRHLRLLDLSRTDVVTVPNSIVNLQNLQRLNLEYCRYLRELPEGISKMGNLKHLKIHECISLTRMPSHLGRLTKLLTLSKFLVGKVHGRMITELQYLNLLRGQLRIDNIENVMNSLEAKGANLKAKEELSVLSLWWKASIDVAPAEAMDEDVLEGLQPHSNLEQLVVVGYRGDRFPNWIKTAELLSSYRYLVSITLNRLKRCERLPPLGLLPSLKILNISEMIAVREIDSEFYGDTGIFPLLQELTFWNMPNLERWSTEATLPGIELFPCLARFNVKGCPILTPEPCLPLSILEVKMSYSNIGLLVAGDLAGQRSSSLKKLEIDHCYSSVSSPRWDTLRYLTSLEDLTIESCEELVSLPEDASFAQQQPHQHQVSSIRRLAVRNNPDLASLGEGFYTSLQYLEITGCDKLASLPEWLNELASLQSLVIRSCPNLTALPDSLENLRVLQDLTIWHCPHLITRLDTRTGEDWQKIAHIPNIDLM